MSRLYHTEIGHVVATLSEELTRYRRARKVLSLPGTSAPGILYVLARPYPDCQQPLHVAVNGERLPSIDPLPLAEYLWYQAALPPSVLRPGDHRFEFWTDSSAMDCWSLGLEAGHKEPMSWISDDGGASWRNEKMGFLNVLRGEYVVRVRLNEGQDPTPPELVFENPAQPRLKDLCQRIPRDSLQAERPLDKVRALSSWLSASWEHAGNHIGDVYSPWDAETILSWGANQKGHAGVRPIAMCVHYATALVSFSQAIGIPARSVVFWPELNSFGGHFVAEVWLEAYDKWVMVDPNADAIYWRGGDPMSATELMSEVIGGGKNLEEFVEWGPGTVSQLQNPRMEEWLQGTYLDGEWLRHRSVWWRSDLLSRPELSPPGHGFTACCETGLVWEKKDLDMGFGMFPYFGDAKYFDSPPTISK